MSSVKLELEAKNKSSSKIDFVDTLCLFFDFDSCLVIEISITRRKLRRSFDNFFYGYLFCFSTN